LPKAARARGWLEFWNGETPIYANARHKLLHYKSVAQGIALHIPSCSARVLDYGCGEALCASQLAQNCERLLLFDAAPYVRKKLYKNFSEDPRIEILEDTALFGVADASLDLIVANSIIQYVPPNELFDLLAIWRVKLKPQGRLLIADIPRAKGALEDALALLDFGWRGGFFIAALTSLARLYFSDYRLLRRELGFFAYDPSEIEEMLLRGGFHGQRQERNIGHNQSRLCFIAEKSHHSSAIADTSRP
jgi:ubiquinone/menaquinone biosynthesis C-methylase UbiE